MPIEKTILLKKNRFDKLRRKIRKARPDPVFVIRCKKNIEKPAVAVKVSAGKRNSLEYVKKDNVVNEQNGNEQ
jgi:hypothetical protein